LDPSGYHVVNVCLHAIVAVMVFAFLRLLLREIFKDNEREKRKTDKIAFIAALIFAIYPINSEVVNWISAVPELTFTPLYLLAFYFYIKANTERKYHFVSLLLFSIALLCKETAIMLPAMLLAYDFIMGIDAHYKSLKRIRRWIARNYLYIAIIVAYLTIRKMIIGTAVQNIGLNFIYILPVFAWSVELFFKNIGEIIYPYRLSIDHIYHIQDFFLFYLAFIFFWLVMFAWFDGLGRKMFSIVSCETRRLFLVCFALFAIPLFPALNYVSLPDCVLDERYLYLPSVGFSLLVAFMIMKLFEYAKKDQLKKMILFGMLMILGGSFYLTVTQRNRQWKDNLSLFSDAVAKNGDSPLARLNLAGTYGDQGSVDQYKAHFEIACRLYSDYKIDDYANCFLAHNYERNIGKAYFNRGDLDNAIRHYKLALSENSHSAETLNNLGLAYYAKHDFFEAKKNLLQAAEISPDSQTIFKNLGRLYCSQGDFSRSERYFFQALKLGSPEDEIIGARVECSSF
jgi:tetratricopeptide (TPR) repeat protein